MFASRSTLVLAHDDHAVPARKAGHGDLSLRSGDHEDGCARGYRDFGECVRRRGEDGTIVMLAFGPVLLLERDGEKRERLVGGVRRHDEWAFAVAVYPAVKRGALC
jgi:hypothetical protein